MGDSFDRWNEENTVDDMQEIIDEFLVECYESLDQLDRDFVTLEENPNDSDRLASIFRTVHTIKGASGFLAFPKLERVAHVGENLLVPLRDGKLKLDVEMADSLLGMVDAIRSIVTNIEESGKEGSDCYEDLLGQLEKILEDENLADSEPVESEAAKRLLESFQASVNKSSEESESIPCETEGDDPKDTLDTDLVVDSATDKVQSTHAPPSSAVDCSIEASVSTKETETPFVDREPPSVIHPSENEMQPTTSPEKAVANKNGRSVSDSTIRIDVELLDKLMNLVGELVLARNQVLQFSDAATEPSLHAASQRLSHITSELQEGVMKTRMQPIRNVWNKLPRVVRDLSASCGKSVEVTMEGADTELDKTILEAIKAPLTHVVRNSVDHGIETVEERVAKGKPACGTLRLRAFHEGGQVNIEISDDGGGIDPHRIRDKAISKGMVSTDQASRLDDRELVNLILLPGFSTAEHVTNVSGRGVGMDVVKTNIERIGGSIDIQSEVGKGTNLRIKIPLTLAIIPALIVTTGTSHYAIPQVNLLELVRLSGDRIREIEFIHDAPVYRLRGKLLPLVYLDEQLGIRPSRSRDEYGETASIVVLHAEGRSFGLVVDSVIDTQEIVVKPLGQHLKSISIYAGATIMGDGQVALILDAVGLAQKGDFLNKAREPVISDVGRIDQSSDAISQSLLVVESQQNVRSAIRLSAVSRLEEFESSAIEESQHGKVMQYRNAIMPLICLESGCSISQTDRTHIVVYSHGSKNIGIIVGKIIDIVKTNEHTKYEQGQLVIQNRITELVDLDELVMQHRPEYFTPECEKEMQYV